MNPIENGKEITENEFSLQQVVRRLLTIYQPLAVKQNSLFINDVPPALTILTDRTVVSGLLGDLLSMLARCCRNTSIKISAKAYHDIILMHIKDTSTFNSYAISSELQHMQLLSGKIGGYLDLTSQRKKETTIAFSFINRSEQPSLPNEYDKEIETEEMNERDLLRA